LNQVQVVDKLKFVGPGVIQCLRLFSLNLNAEKKTMRLSPEHGRNALVVRLILFCLVALCAQAASAQSGRRGSKSPAVPVPTPEVEKQVEKKPNSELGKIPLIVGASRNDVFTGVPLNIYDSVLQSCSARLDDSSAVRVEPVSHGLSRSEAVDRAKAMDEGYVVWLHLRGEDMQATYSGNLDAIFIEYVVFEHGTAKVKTSGNCYPGAYRKGGVVLGPNTRSSNTAVVEGRLRIAAEEAAERILKALHLASASDVPEDSDQ